MATHYVRGTAHWAKVVGDPVDNYNKDGKEWVIDVTPDEDGLKLLKKLKLSQKIKDKDDDRKEFIQFKQKATRTDRKTGEVLNNKPPKIVDLEGNDWGSDKIGNGSIVDVKFDVVPYPTGTTGVYLQGVRVLKHVPYGGSGYDDFAPLEEDDEFWAGGKELPKEDKQSKAPTQELDDDLPF